ncbi:MAG: glycohydrolase toxin TNT-related protein, partial [Bacteroidota bacterium]
APGTYTLVMTYGDEVATTSVNVKADPRITYAPDAWAQRDAVTEEIESIVQAATDGFQRLQDMRATTDRIEKAFVNAPTATQDRLKKQSKDLKSSIAEIENLFMEPTDVKGIKRDPTTLMNSLFAMRRYSRNLNGAPSQMLTLAIEQARTQTTEVLAKVNALIAGEYADYQQDVEAVPFSLFEPIGAVRTFEASAVFPEFEDDPDQLAMLEAAAARFTYDGKEGLEAIKAAYTQAGKNGAEFLENLDYTLEHFPQHSAIHFTADEDNDGEVEIITASGITLAEVEDGEGELETFLSNGNPIGSPYDGFQLVSNGSEMGYRVSDYAATVSGIDFNYFIGSVADNFEVSDDYAHESFYYFQEEEWEELEALFTEKELNGGWPPARGGFNQESITFSVGDRFDRYQQKIYAHTSVNGTEVPDMGGTFTSPMVNGEAYSYDARALKPAEAENALYYVIEILEPLEFGGTKADVIPWFGKPGLATQVEFDIPTDPETGRVVTWTELAKKGKIRIRIVASPDGSEKPYVGMVVPGR